MMINDDLDLVPKSFGTTLYNCIASLHLREGTIYSIAISRQHGVVFTGSKSTRIRAWRQPDYMEFGCLQTASEGLLYTGSYDTTVKAWRVLTKNSVDSFVAHEHDVNAILVNQEDGCVFTCSSDVSVKIWRRVLGENSHTLTMTLKFQNYPVNAIALSTSSLNSSCFLYSGSSDGTINFWEKEKLTYRFNHCGFLQGHNFAVLCLVAVEKLVFSGSEDTTIRVWRRGEGSCFHECLAVLDGHRGPVGCLAACLETDRIVVGFLVYSASLDQSFKVWRVKGSPEEKMGLNYRDRSFSNPVLSPIHGLRESCFKGRHFQ
ncbi:hypothetical protein ACFX13_044104 [Malus domestica]